MASDPRLFGLALAGGRSVRFGSEKAAALLHGRPLLHWALTHLDGSCARAAVSARPGTAAEAIARAQGRPVLHDAPEHAGGPLAGMAAGLAWAAGEGAHLLAVEPTDTPWLPPALHGALAGALGPAPAAFAETAQGPHPLCAVLRVEMLAEVEAALAGGGHPSVWRWLDGLGAVRVRFDDPAAFANVNVADDIA